MATQQISGQNGLSHEAKRDAAVFALMIGAVVWSYWTTLTGMATRWAHDAQYSHGWLVPLFAGVFLWLRRDKFPAEKLKPSLWGVVLLIAAAALRLASTILYFEWFEALSLIPCVAGVFLLCGGWAVLGWAWPSVLFLTFMVPLPYRLEVAMKKPLRDVGTVVTTYVMQTVGLPAFADGNIIVTDNAKIGVAEACSGLRMLVIFFALSTAVAMLSQRALWERLLIIASAAPIAIIANVMRITVTGLLHEFAGAEIAELVFHDLAGWLMMPLALALMWLELWLLSKLFFVEHEEPLAPLAGLSPLSPIAVGAASKSAGKPAPAGRRSLT